MHVSAEEGRQRSVQNGLDTLSACITSLDSGLDKQKFLEYNHSAFMIPKKLEFQGQKTDDVSYERGRCFGNLVLILMICFWFCKLHVYSMVDSVASAMENRRKLSQARL